MTAPVAVLEDALSRKRLPLIIGAFEAHQKPMLALPAIFALPNAAHHIIG
jgi:hypothetical protein